MEEEKSASIIKKDLSSPIALLEDAIKMYRQGFWKFMGLLGIQFLGALPLGAVLVLYNLGARFLKEDVILLMLNVVLGVIGLISVIFFIYIVLSTYASILLLLKDFNINKSVKDLFNEGRAYAIKYLVVSVHVGIRIILWSLLLIVPGIIYAVRYSLSTYTLMMEGKESTSALKRSEELVKGYWWAVAGRAIFFGVIMIIFSFIISMPLMALQEGTAMYIAWDAILNIVNFILAPLYTIYVFLIFKELVRIKGDVKIEI